MEAVVGESLVCERDPENASNRYGVAVKKRNYHRTFASKGIASVFAVFATVRYYRMYSNRAQEIFS